MISVILSSITCSAWASLAALLDAAMRLPGLTGERFIGSNSVGRFLFSQRAKGPAARTSPYCGLGAGDGVGAGAAEVGIDGQDVFALDLRAGGGASYFLKLDISEKKKTRISSKTRIAENTRL